MTCEMYFLLMPNLIVDSPGKHQSKGKALVSRYFCHPSPVAVKRTPWVALG